ncbi:hypothetical protein [Magnetococcus sp. PR-3]|uniref:hypothetical protein n=1 Tax=Magnetococcus sp. PR-3 TaxID=3120355 RepID=UPI002FCDFD64
MHQAHGGIHNAQGEHAAHPVTSAPQGADLSHPSHTAPSDHGHLHSGGLHDHMGDMLVARSHPPAHTTGQHPQLMLANAAPNGFFDPLERPPAPHACYLT